MEWKQKHTKSFKLTALHVIVKNRTPWVREHTTMPLNQTTRTFMPTQTCVSVKNEYHTIFTT